jgi:transcriptional regulator with XRE-family HTH domain
MNESKLKDRFGKRVQSLRHIRGLTQERLAERTGLSVEYISKVERGLASPSFRTIARLSNVLDVPVLALFDFSKLDESQKS